MDIKLKIILSLCMLGGYFMGWGQCPSELDFAISEPHCVGQQIEFTDIKSSSPGGSFTFIVEGNEISNPPYTYIFNADGPQRITLRRTDPSGCTNEVSKEIVINELPKPEFTFNTDNSNPPCSETPVQFTNGSSPSTGLTYLWDFGDGNTSTEKDPLHVFDAFGSGNKAFDVKLTVTDQASGCPKEITKEVTVKARPDIILRDEFGQAYSDFKNCDEANAANPEFEITFTDDTQGANLTQYEVSWGDGTSDYIGSDPPSGHTYNDLGVYDITYKVTGQDGCVATKIFKVLNISNPSVGASLPEGTIGCAPLGVKFTLLKFEGNASSTIYEIDPGDGSGIQTLSHPPDPEFFHEYNTTSCGELNNAFTFTVTAKNGCEPSIANLNPIKVYTPPVAAIEAPSVFGCVGQPITFKNTTEDGFNSSCENSARFEWDFGDGQTETTFDNADVSHSYENHGKYTVKIKAINGCGESEASTEVEICDQVPTSQFTAELNGESASSSAECADDVVEFVLPPDGSCPPLTINLNDNSTAGCNDTYLWEVIEGEGFEFTNGHSISDEPNEQITINKGGFFIIRQTVTGVCGSTSSCLSFMVQESPDNVEIQNLKETYCETEPIDLDATGSEDENKYTWSFRGREGTPDPTVDIDLTVKDIAPFLLPPGEYVADLKVNNSCGEKSVSKDFSVTLVPEASINPPEDAVICEGSFHELKANIGDNLTYQWLLNGNPITSERSSTLNAKSKGTYSVEVYRGGCKATSNEVIVTTIEGPEAIISVDGDDSFCEGSEINTILKVNEIENADYQWFKDGNKMDGATGLTLEVTEAGNYYAEVTTKLPTEPTTELCKVNSNTITISNIPLPDPDFETSSPYCVGEEITFTNLTPGIPGHTINFEWDFDDGSTKSNTKDGVHTFESEGSFTILLTASIGKCSESIEKTISVVLPPAISFTKSILPEDGCGPVTVNFENKSEGIGLTYQWDFGNGQTSTQETPEPITFQPSVFRDTTYIIILKASNACSEIEFIDSIKVRPTPVARFLFEQNVICAGYPLPIDNFSTGLADAFIWDFGDGSSPVKTTDLGTITHAFPNIGKTDTTFEVSLTATNACGTNVLTQTITVTPNTVSAFYNIDVKRGCTPHEVTLTSNQIEESGNEILWIWGDGETTLGGISATHIYDEADNYYPQLVVRNGCNIDTCGGVNSVCGIPIEVLPSPTASFEMESSICMGEPITFKNTSTSTINSRWNFGNGDTYVGTEPLPYTYHTPGTYSVTLTVTGVNGCDSQPMVQTVTVRPLPIADFTISNPVICEDDPVIFENHSKGAKSYSWEIEGVAQPVTQENFSTVFPDPRLYTITLTAFDDVSQSECSGQKMQTINVLEKPKPDFTMHTSYDCGMLEAVFTDNTTYPPPGLGTFCWNFGGADNCSITDEDLTRQYENLEDVSQVYPISLTVTDINGCTNKTTKNLEIPPFIANVKTPENNKAIAFTPDSKNNSIFILPTEGDIGSFEMRIYQTWGTEVFTTTDPAQGWDGYYRGAPAPTGLYNVVVSYTDCNNRKRPEKNVQLYLLRKE